MKHSLLRAGALAFALAMIALVVPPALAQATCKGCHADFTKVLPTGHPPAKGASLDACLACHKPDVAGNPAKNGFSVAMHRGHVKDKGGVPCTACHVVAAKGKPGVAKGKVVLVVDKEVMQLVTGVMTDASAAKWTGGLHAKAGFGCASCHGAAVPGSGGEVATDRCLACHGPMEKLVEKTKPAEHADRNPHHSHLVDVACTVCHKGHQASKVYCLDCHPKWPMKIQGAG